MNKTALALALAIALAPASAEPPDSSPPYVVDGRYCTQEEADNLPGTYLARTWAHWSTDAPPMRDPVPVQRYIRVNRDLTVVEMSFSIPRTVTGVLGQIDELGVVDPANAIPTDCQWNWWWPVGVGLAESYLFRTAEGYVYSDFVDLEQTRTVRDWQGFGWLYKNGSPRDVRLMDAVKVKR